MNSPFEHPENKLSLGFTKSQVSPILKSDVLSSMGMFKVELGGAIQGMNLPERSLRYMAMSHRLSQVQKKLTPSSAKRLANIWASVGTIGAQNPLTAEQLITATTGTGKSSANLTTLLKAKAWGKAVGVNPIFIDNSSSFTNEQLAQITLHEKIHAMHLADPDNPFFARKLNQEVFGTKVLPSLRRSLPRDPGIRSMYAENISSMPKAQRATVLKSERLAYGLQSHPEVVDEMRLAGLTDFDTLAKNLVAKNASRKLALKEIKRVMHNGEGASRAGTGIYSLLARGVRRFASV